MAGGTFCISVCVICYAISVAEEAEPGNFALVPTWANCISQAWAPGVPLQATIKGICLAVPQPFIVTSRW